ncbi:CMP-N-acetylneuraminate-beta-1,4-galactoside alpha-2,3-sialyltransferase-like [Leptonychotes weddellii]|uniref:CMP-N-acetylneuraminate-beta-1,4-galactoside alpha-2,3-sialyltransferase-like n=1 Tax=Leptonychotes weddellii TaxID=9713 RepID=A0A7F8PXE8_LEPWE|nr:CMP-N-acetylneuraminate-beta-1,4-galactoside alpha-2,3-sialyltransferase-like [Leptonychotes weddellii]
MGLVMPPVCKSASDGFWKSVATRVPKEPPEIRILNPYFIQEAAFTLIGLPFNNGLMGRGNIPTLGSVAVTMALHGCDEVAVAGFGYDMSTPNAPLHYYETVRMAAIKEVPGWATSSDEKLLQEFKRDLENQERPYSGAPRSPRQRVRGRNQLTRGFVGRGEELGLDSEGQEELREAFGL